MYFSTKVLKYQQIQYFFSTKTVASETKYLPDAATNCLIIITGFQNDTTAPYMDPLRHVIPLTYVWTLAIRSYFLRLPNPPLDPP